MVCISLAFGCDTDTRTGERDFYSMRYGPDWSRIPLVEPYEMIETDGDYLIGRRWDCSSPLPLDIGFGIGTPVQTLKAVRRIAVSGEYVVGEMAADDSVNRSASFFIFRMSPLARKGPGIYTDTPDLTVALTQSTSFPLLAGAVIDSDATQAIESYIKRREELVLEGYFVKFIGKEEDCANTRLFFTETDLRAALSVLGVDEGIELQTIESVRSDFADGGSCAWFPDQQPEGAEDGTSLDSEISTSTSPIAG